MSSISFRKRIKIDDTTTLNISKKGFSISKKVGNTTVNSRGTVTTNLGNGIILRDSLKPKTTKKNSKNK